MRDDLTSTGEDGLIHRLCRLIPPGPGLIVGPGDDCAVLPSPNPGDYLLFKTDAVIEGIHFTPGTEARRVGWKAAARAVSDFAAMGGGKPEHALVSLFVQPGRPVSWLEDVYRGIQDCANRFGFGLAGGETCRLPMEAPGLILSISLLGRTAKSQCILRSGASIGDDIWVTGSLGGSFATGKHLDFVPRIEEAQILASSGIVHSLMDLSDGLAKDLPRLAQASRAGFRLDRDAIPVTPGFTLENALSDGEDYELLFTMAPGTPCPLQGATRIGNMVGMDESEQITGGWDHFATL